MKWYKERDLDALNILGLILLRRSFVDFTGGFSGWSTIFFDLLVTILVWLSILRFRRFEVKRWFVYIGILFLFLLELVFYGRSSYFLSYNMYFIYLAYLPAAALILSSISYWELALPVLKKYCIAGCLMNLVGFVFLNYIHSVPYMTYSHDIILYIGFLYVYIRTGTMKKRYSIPLLCGSIVTLLYLSCRSALVCIVLFLLAYEFISIKLFTWKKLVSLMTLSIAIVSFFISGAFTRLALSLYEKTGNYALKYLVQNDFFNQDGRDMLLSETISLIKARPLAGYGLFGDRYVLETVLNVKTYPHNIALEVLLHFGVIVGSFILLRLFLLIVRAYSSKNQTEHMLVLLFTFLILGRYFFSGSYLNEALFYCYVGVMAGICCSNTQRVPVKQNIELGVVNDKQNIKCNKEYTHRPV